MQAHLCMQLCDTTMKRLIHSLFALFTFPIFIPSLAIPSPALFVSSLFRSTLLQSSLPLSILTLSTLLIASPSIANASALENHQTTELPSLPGAATALYIQDVSTGAMVASHLSQQWMQPASTQKILTALVAKQRLGSNFRYSTTIHSDKRGAVIGFNGDPTLTRQQLARLLRQGITQNKSLFSGDIYLSNSTFVGEDRAVGVPWDTLGVCYAAPATGIALEKNCVQGALYSNRGEGQLTRLNVPTHHLITVDNQVKVVSKATQETTFCELTLQAHPNNHYQLSGCLVQREQPLPLNFAIQDPAQYMTDVIHAELKRLGIPFSGNIYLTNKPSTSPALHQHLSQPLNTLLADVLQKSNNVLTDSLLRTLGAQQGNGSFTYGAHVLKQHLAALFEDDKWLSTPLSDGSGLSRNNRLTTLQLAQVLTYIAKHEPELLAIFPISGESGTLRYRRSVRHAPLKGKIQAKTGSLYGASNLAGFVTTESGKKLLVIQLVNDYFWQPKPNTESPLIQFERALYSELVSQY